MTSEPVGCDTCSLRTTTTLSHTSAWICSSRAPHGSGSPETRPQGVPRTARYGPIVTFLQTLVDMKNSMTVVPGVFEAKGHDYRADLACFVRAVYRLDASEEQMERIEDALRAFESRRGKVDRGA